MSGADIVEILRRAASRKAMEEIKTGAFSPISQQDILTGIQKFRTNG